jgi:integrase
MTTTWLTETFIRQLQPPGTGAKITYDGLDPKGRAGVVSGFGIRCTAAGHKSFILNYRVNGRERRLTIGAWPVWTLAAARAEATDLKRRIAKGADPLGEIEAKRNAVTVSQLADRFLEEHVARRRPSTQRDYRAAVEIIKHTMGRRHVSAIETTDIEKLHREITGRAPVRANRIYAVAAMMFALAVKWKMRDDNPAKGIERNRETARQRYLNGDELARLTAALAEHRDQQACDIIRILLLTGSRRGEVQAARWEQIDFERAIWSKPASATKQNKRHDVPLSAPVMRLLTNLYRRRDPGSPYVFPGRNEGAPRSKIGRNWEAVCKAAQIAGLRMHDLRHSFASELINSGHGLPIIGSLLGHSRPETTNRYSHLYDATLRDAVDRVGSRMSGLVVTKRPAKAKLKIIGTDR